MSGTKYYVDIKEKQIPIIVRNYNNTCRFKIYFKNNILHVNKPSAQKHEEVIRLIKENEDAIYNQYIQIISVENKAIKHWNNGEKLMYNGKLLDVVSRINNKNKIGVELKLDEELIEVTIPENINYEKKKECIDKALKGLLKHNTTVMIQERLPILSKKINVKYNSFSVRDSLTRFGSCNTIRKTLSFNSRLIMLPEDKVDAIIVHELCHIIHPNHSQDFYNLVKRYQTDYEECDKWLKENAKHINF